MYPNLKAEQARIGMTNQQVADFLGICRKSYEQKKKSGRFTPNECLKLMKLFSCSFEELFETEADRAC